MNMSLSKPSEIICGDCVEQMMRMPDNSIDAVVTDPPYGLAFMGKSWDTHKDNAAFQEWCEEWLVECLRVLKPGGHLLAFGGTRTWHRLACAVEDTGFEIRDSIAWMYGSGFPKSLDVSKAIDKAAGAEREVIGKTSRCVGPSQSVGHLGTTTFREPNWQASNDLTAPATPDAERWQGWGTALKPAFEPIVVARKPLAGTVAANVLEYGTGGLNIDGCRVEGAFESGWSKSGSKASKNGSMSGGNYAREPKPDNETGRWPANVVLGHSEGCKVISVKDDKIIRNTTTGWTGFGQKKRPKYKTRKVVTAREEWSCVIGCPVAELDQQSGVSVSGMANVDKPMKRQDNEVYGKGLGSIGPSNTYADTGGASRFFYQAKANKKERPEYTNHEGKKVVHPTVKPLALMEYLVKLVTQSDGTVLDPFAGSGTTLEACANLGIRCIAIEMDEDYIALMGQRLNR